MLLRDSHPPNGRSFLAKRASFQRGFTADRHSHGLQGEPLEERRMMAVDVILEWNDVMLEANANDHARTRPSRAARS